MSDVKKNQCYCFKNIPLGEADLIVTHLTYDFRSYKYICQKPQKNKEQIRSSLEPLTCSKISFWGKEDTRLPRLTQSDIILSFQALREDGIVSLRFQK